MDKIKRVLFSERGTGIVNVLFLLSLFFRNSGIIFATYIVWILYLSYCVKIARSKASKGIYSAIIIFAGVMVVLNFYFLFRTL